MKKRSKTTPIKFDDKKAIKKLQLIKNLRYKDKDYTKNNLSRTYLETYNYVLKSNYNPNSESDIVNCMMVTFSWNPSTIVLHINNTTTPIIDFKKELLFISNPKCDISSTEFLEHLTKMKEILDNSTISVSKFLHFMFPDRFPMFDSKILKLLPGVGKSPKGYIKYLNLIKELLRIKNPEINSFQMEFKKLYNYGISKMRACELILFLNA